MVMIVIQVVHIVPEAVVMVGLYIISTAPLKVVVMVIVHNRYCTTSYCSDGDDNI